MTKMQNFKFGAGFVPLIGTGVSFVLMMGIAFANASPQISMAAM